VAVHRAPCAAWGREFWGGISCAAQADCVAVGEGNPFQHEDQGFAETDTQGTWSVGALPIPRPRDPCGNGLRETPEQQPRMRSPYETLGYSGISFVVNL